MVINYKQVRLTLGGTAFLNKNCNACYVRQLSSILGKDQRPFAATWAVALQHTHLHFSFWLELDVPIIRYHKAEQDSEATLRLSLLNALDVK